MVNTSSFAVINFLDGITRDPSFTKYYDNSFVSSHLAFDDWVANLSQVTAKPTVQRGYKGEWDWLTDIFDIHFGKFT